MHQRRPPVPVIIILLLALLVGGYYGLRAMNNGTNGALSASGSIEATTVNVSPEVSGKVAEVLVGEGQAIAADTPLFRLDGSLLGCLVCAPLQPSLGRSGTYRALVSFSA